MKFIVFFSILLVNLNTYAQVCDKANVKTSRSYRISADQLLADGVSEARIKLNGRTYLINNANKNLKIRLKRGVNKVKIITETCKYSQLIVNSPKIFFRPYGTQNTVEKLKFTRIIENPEGVSESAPSAESISDSLRETSPHLDANLKLGTVFFAQFVDHDLTANNQFQNGPSSNPLAPENIQSPNLDLDNLYGFGRGTDTRLYEDNKLYFLLTNDGNDIPRSEDGVALIPDKRDDITGLTLTIHVMFKRYHNHLIRKYLRGKNPNELNRKQKKWLFEMVRNEVIGTYQKIIANELSDALIGRGINRNGIDPISNVPVEFAAAGFRIGHSLVPDEVKINQSGDTLSPIDSSLRGPERIVINPDLLFGDSAQPAARFDNLIAPVMQELIIPLSPTNPGLTEMVGGEANNIGSGRVVDGTLRLDLVETNILRSREQGLPTGEEILAKINGTEYSGTGTDLFVYILNEATDSQFRYGPVGTYIYEQTISGLLNNDKYSIFNRKYTKRDKRRFKRFSLEKVAKKSFS